MNVYRFPLMLLAIHVGVASCLLGAEGNDPFVKIEPPALIGRWDLTVKDGEQVYPSWLEISLSGYRTLVGRYVGQFGSARPIAQIQFDAKAGAFAFSLPPQWEKRTSDILFGGRLQDEGFDVERIVRWFALLIGDDDLCGTSQQLAFACPSVLHRQITFLECTRRPSCVTLGAYVRGYSQENRESAHYVCLANSRVRNRSRLCS